MDVYVAAHTATGDEEKTFSGCKDKESCKN